MSEVKYSAIRHSIIETLQQHPVFPISWKIKKLDGDEDTTVAELADKLELTAKLYTHVMPFNIRLKTQRLIDNALKDGDLNYFLADNLSLIGHLIAWGIVDEKGDPVFSEQDAILISSKYDILVYHLCWEVLKANNFTQATQQDTVKN